MPGTEERLMQALQRLGWTAADLARRLGVSQPTVHAWLHGRHGLRRANAARVAEVLDVSVTWLLFGDDRGAEATARDAQELALLRLFREADEAARQDALRRLRQAA